MSYNTYQRHVWEKGDLISALKLNELEGGILTASNSLNLLGESVSYGIIDSAEPLGIVDANGQSTWMNNPELAASNDNRLITGRAVFNACGVANGIATLDGNGLVPTSQLPSYVDDILEGFYHDGKFYKNKTGVEGNYQYENEYFGGKTNQAGEEDQTASGEKGKIYVDLDTKYTYRWTSGAGFIEITSDNIYAKKTDTDLLGYLKTKGNTTLEQNLTVGTPVTADGASTYPNATLLNTTLQVQSTSTFNDDVTIATGKSLAVGKDISVGANLSVTGTTTLTGTATLNGAATLNSTLTVNGATTFNNTVTLAANKNLTVGGNTSITGTLEVTGATTLNSTLTVTGKLSANDDVEIAAAKDLKVKKGSIILGDTSTANNTIYAIASASQLGSIKVGADLAIDANGVLSGNYGIADNYNSSSNKLATVATVTNAVNALDQSSITGFGADKTLQTLSEADGIISASFQPIQIAESQVTSLVDDLAARVLKTTTISAGEGLTGGGSLEANRTISHDVPTGAGTSNNITSTANTFINSITFDKFGHVTAVGTGTEFTYTHPTPAGLGGAQTSGLYKISTDADGHVTGVTAATKDDILGLLGVSEADFDALFETENP